MPATIPSQAYLESLMNIDLKAIRASEAGRQLLGICAGLGEHTPVPAWMWRAVFVLLACWHGYGAALYLVIGMYMPQPGTAPEKNADDTASTLDESFGTVRT